jgi:hypothetical protein
MMAALTGRVHGNTITLDAPVPPFEGMRVLVRIETVQVDADATLPREVHARLWQEWIEIGPQGPILP